MSTIKVNNIVTPNNGESVSITTGGTQRVTVDSSGNVGIGTTSPGGYGNFADDLVVYNSSQPGITLATGTSGYGSIYFADGTVGNAASRGQIQYNHNDDSLLFASAASERLRIDSSGRLLVGTTTAGSGQLTVASTSHTGITIRSGNTSTNSNLIFADAASGADVGVIQYSHSTDSLRFTANNAERLRIDSSGRLLVGSGAISTPKVNTGGIDISTHNIAIVFGGSSLSGTNTLRANNATKDGRIAAAHYSNTEEPVGVVRVISNSTENQLHWGGGSSIINAATDHRFYTASNNTTTGGFERMRIDSSGNLLIGKTVEASATQGINLDGSIGFGGFTRNGGAALLVNRGTNDGTLVNFLQNDNLEGSINVSGSTVSLVGGHLSRWSQLPGGVVRTEILRGSVLSNLDEMCEWGEEDNEQLNRMKVSDVEGDKNVSGVFQAWDDDDDTYTNDFYCAMTGDFVIRIAQGTTVARGDLLMSAGDGTAKPQDDDIVRSKTIAKVTSTTVSETYADNSYCVPCVLMAC